MKHELDKEKIKTKNIVFHISLSMIKQCLKAERVTSPNFPSENENL